ncbi:MAG TPA: hypothetical protein VM753_01415 [Anaeromyxobacter sp.]|jgi:hypothetical protein|nr:hypothetical protein [Anaeromyxobacter sp.]
MRPPLRVIAVLLGVGAAHARGDDLAARAARSYVLDTARSPTTLQVGERAVLTVAIRCAPGVHVQSQAPLRVQASASPGLLLARDRLGWSDVRGGLDAPELDLPVTAAAPGAHEAQLRLEFFLCSRAWCVRQDRRVVLPVTVADGAAADGSASSAGAAVPRRGE